MGTVKDLAEALTEKLKEIGRHPTIPLPQFRGKQGEEPNDHCMKVEDYMMTNIPKSKRKSPSNGYFSRDLPRKEGLLM